MKHLISYALALVLALSMGGCLSEEPLDDNSSFDSTLTESIQSTMSIASVSIDGVALNLQNSASIDAQEVTLSPTLRIAFSQSLLPATVSAQSVILKKETSVINLSWSVNDKNVTLSPDTILENNTTYTLTFRNTIENTNGAKLYKEYTFSFKTVDESLLVANSIAATHITSGRNAVDTNFSVLFSDAIVIDDATSIRLVNTATSTTTAITTSIIGNKLHIDPVGDLNTSATYEVRILAGAVSKASTRLPLYTTATQTFVISPHARPVATPIAVNIIEPSSAIIVDFGTSLTSSSLDGVSATNAFSKSLGSTTAIRVVPNGLWSEGSLTLSFDTNVTNIDGVSMQTTYTKTLNVNALPYVASTDFNGSTDIRIDRNISVVFSESIDKESTIVGVTLKNSANASVTASHYWDETNRTLTIDPSGDLTPSSNYSVTLANTITDASGRALLSSYTLGFTTNANTRPSILSTAPAHNATGVGIDANYTVTFSEEVNRSIVEAGGVTIEGVSVTYGWSGDGKSVTLSPLGYLNTDANYTVIVSPTVVDLTGFAVAQENRYAFRTGANARPTVTTTTMGTAHYIDANFTITFSEAMTAADTIKLSGASIPHTWENNNTQVTLKPSSYLSPSTTYVLRVPTSLTDTTGLTLAQEYNYTFTTHSNRAPAVSSRSFSRPADTTTQAAIDSNISVLFDTNVSIADSTKITCVDVNRSANFGISVASNDTTQVRITPSSDWNVSTNYLCTFGAGAVKETVSGILTTQESNVTFTTSQYGRPVVQHSIFNYDVNDSMSVDLGVTLHSSSTSNVSITGRTDGFTVSIVDAQKLRIAPTYPWATGTLYLNLGQAIANIDGTPMASAHQLGLTILEAPRVSSTSPQNSATGIFGTQKAEITFDKNIYDTSDNCIKVEENGTLKGSYGDANGSSIIAISSIAWLPNTQYRLTVSANCVKESTGSVTLPSEYNFSFSTIKVTPIHEIFGNPSNEKFGASIAISGDGNHTVIGASDVNRSYYVDFNTTAQTWQKKGANDGIYSGTTGNAGSSVAIDYNGTWSLQGVPNKDNTEGTETNQGAMHRVYNPSLGYTTPIASGSAVDVKLGTSVAMDYNGSISVARGNLIELSIRNEEKNWTETKQPGNFASNVPVVIAGNARTIAFVEGPNGNTYRVTTYDMDAAGAYVDGLKKVHTLNSTFELNEFYSLDISADGLRLIVGGRAASDGFEIYHRTGIDQNFTNTNDGRKLSIVETSKYTPQVAISGDGNTVVVGWPADNTVNYYGEVQIYRYINNAWTYVTTLYEPTQGVGYKFGSRVDINNDGSVIVIADAPDRNKVYIYQP